MSIANMSGCSSQQQVKSRKQKEIDRQVAWKLRRHAKAFALFKKTGKVALIPIFFFVRYKPKFLSSKVTEVRRGSRVTILDMKGSWCFVITSHKRKGWVHTNALFPKSLHLSSGDTGSGTFRGEAVFAARG